jgi:hypothetical protein
MRDVIGFRIRLNVPDDQPGDPKILQQRILLFAGFFLLGMGIWSAWRYFHIQPPADTTLHPVSLQDVLAVTDVPEPFATNETGAVELHTRDNRVIHYGAHWPYFDRVSHCDTNLTLLVDTTNQVWVVKDIAGNDFGRPYFQKLNMEVKSVSGAVAIFFIPLGAFAFLPALAMEYRLRRGAKLPGTSAPVSARKFTLFGSLVGYVFVFGLIIGPWLSAKLPPMIVGLIWIVSGGALATLILRYFQRKSNKPGESVEQSRAGGSPQQGGNSSTESR